VILELWNQRFTTTEIADQLDISKFVVSKRVCAMRRRGDVRVRTAGKGRPPGTGNRASRPHRPDPAKAARNREILERWNAGETQIALAADYGITHSQVCKIIRRIRRTERETYVRKAR